MTTTTAVSINDTPPLKDGRRPDLRSALFVGVLWLCLTLAGLFLLFVMIEIITRGVGRFDANLINRPPSRVRPENGGVRPAILGTLIVVGMTALMALPIGVAAAIYLEEYADKTRWFNRMIELNIQNLAAVPSVIFGILVLAFVVRNPLNFGAVAISGAIALALLILPVVIISTREALRAVPTEIRDGSLALGATRWQTMWRQLLPSAVPGIATGSILALSRAIGEAAPLILVGATTFVTFDPDSPFSRYTVLPVQIYTLVPQPDQPSKDLAYGAILLLIVILVAMNALAIYLRNRFQRRW